MEKGIKILKLTGIMALFAIVSFASKSFFAKADIDTNIKVDAKILKAEIMETVYLENQGQKGFVKHNLPIQTQYSTIHGIVLDDFNKDGKKDMLLAGNDTWIRIKFGRYAANHGVLLFGDGKNNFKYVEQSKSGLNLKGNIRTLKLLKTEKSFKILAGINDQAVEVISPN